MEEYKASVQGVDDALARLNATLASYKSLTLQSKPERQEASKKVQVDKTTPGEQPALVSQDRPSAIVLRTYQVISKVSSGSVSLEVWEANSYGAASQRYVQV